MAQTTSFDESSGLGIFAAIFGAFAFIANVVRDTAKLRAQYGSNGED